MLSSISSRMITATIALVIICSTSFLLLSMKEHESTYRRTVINHLDALTRNLADDLLPLLGDDGDPLEITTKLLDLGMYDNVKFAIVYDRQKQVVQQYLAPELMQPSSSLPTLPNFDINEVNFGTSIIGGDLIAFRPVGDETYSQGYLLVVNHYRTALNRSNRALLISSLPVALGILVAMISLAILLNRLTLSPLSNLASFTNSIESSRNYHLRYQGRGNDEISNLGKYINAMLSRIEAQDLKSQEHTETLEQQQQALKKLANYDTLTNLPNRKFFMETLRIELSRTRRRGCNLMILFLDLDNFKGINDSLGHDAGDALLVKVSALINQQLREGDILARLGGDEFLVLLNDVAGDVVDLAINVAERIISALEQPITLGEWEVQSGVSIGIADGRSSDFDTETIVRNADIAMYQAKASGRGRYAMFQQELQSQTMRKMVIANSLTKALEDGEFKVAYQLKVGHNNIINGLEALIRWESPAEGFISPAEFIPVAEHSGKITAISRWMIKAVFSDYEKILNIAGESAVVSINLSAHDIKDPHFIDFIRVQASVLQIDTSKFEFEITESAYLDNFQEAIGFFKQLRKLGFSIALDDFGTGYSSLSYLTQIEIDTLKIDQQFVKMMESSSRDKLIIETIINLAHNLELNVCAEGVETAEQRAFLVQQGCQQLQGYYFAKPCALDQIPIAIATIAPESPVAYH